MEPLQGLQGEPPGGGGGTGRGKRARSEVAGVSVLEALRNAASQRAPTWELNGAPLRASSCPVCGTRVTTAEMNDHLDACLTSSSGPGERYEPALDVLPATAERLQAVAPLEPERSACSVQFSGWRPTYTTARTVGVDRPAPGNPGTEGVPAMDTEAFNPPADDDPDDASAGGAARPQRYYLRAFRTVVDYVTREQAHLLNREDCAVLDAFQASSPGAQKLFVRLFKRKRGWLRVVEIRYDDLDVGPESAVDELVGANLLTQCDGSEGAEVGEVEGILATLRADEVRRLARPLQSKRRGTLTKAGGEALLRANLRNTTSRTISGTSVADNTARMIAAAAGRLVRVSDGASGLFERIHLVFFAPEGPRSPALMLADLGRAKFHPYACRVSRPVFPSRAALFAYVDARQLEARLEQAAVCSDHEAVLEAGREAEEALRQFVETRDRRQSEAAAASRGPALECVEALSQLDHPFLRRLTHLFVLAGVAWHSVATMERLKDHEGAVSRLRLLLASQLTPSRGGKILNRLTIDLKDHLGQPSEALRLCLDALREEDAWSIQRGERIQLAKRARRLWRALHSREEVPTDVAQLLGSDSAAWTKVPERMIFGRPLDEYRAQGASSMFVGYTGDRVSVEQLSLQSYRAEAGWDGVHCEGSLVRALFALLLWDVIFHDVADVFRTPFQDAPLDLGTEAFYVSRRELLGARLDELAKMDGQAVESEARRSWELHEGTRCRGMTWKEPQTSAPEVARCIGGCVLAAMFRLLAIDYNYWSGGMPDLLLWRASDSAAMFVEVKGPRDSLMDRQRAWMHELLASGAKVEVCRIVERVTARNEAAIVGDHDGHELARLDGDAEPS